MTVCIVCGGEGQELIGERRVTLDMAIDAGDRNLEGLFYKYEYEICPNCLGTGLVEEEMVDAQQD